MILVVLPLLSFTLWAIGFLCLIPSVIRIYRNQPRPADEWRAVSMFSAGLIMAFNLRRAIMADDHQALPALYCLSILLAVYVLLLLWKRKG